MRIIAQKLLAELTARRMIALALSFVGASQAWAGPFPPAAGQEGSTAVSMHDERFVAWATGWTNFVEGTQLDAYWAEPGRALGPATGDAFDVVSLGNGGHLTMTFSTPIVNGPGHDFAVFGNSFNDHFLELAFVEVSSDGTNFFRFHNESLTPEAVPFWGAHMDPTLIDGLAGKYRVGYGMPFDLEELKGVSPLLDVHDVRFVRLVDIIGGSATDSVGRIIYDPSPTTGSAGFDLEAVGVLNAWTPLHAWRVAHFGHDAYADNAADDADWSGDGIANLVAYALALDPTELHTGPLFRLVSVQDDDGIHMELEYERRSNLTEAAIHIALTSTLAEGGWTNGVATITEYVHEEKGETDIMRARPNGSFLNNPHVFFRLEVHKP